MRTTMSTIYAGILSNLNSINSDMNRINSQISSGRQMSKISDNPVNLVSALSLRSSLAEIGQYQENLLYGDSMITAAESSLTQIKEMVMRAKTLDLQLINDDKNLENRQNAAVEIHQMYEEAIILANTQINGKYIFGGYRTSGYTDIEPAPFVGGLIDGYRLNGDSPEALDAMSPAGIVLDSADIAAGDLLIDGEDMGAVDLTSAGLVNGLNMGGTLNLETAINTNSTNVTAGLTTLVSGGTATAGGPTAVSLDLSGSGGGPVAISFDAEGTAVEIAQQTIDAINAVSNQTGIMAYRGNDVNGGVNNSVVLRNGTDGDETAITVANLNDGGLTGIANGSQAADATHNTGQIYLESASAFAFDTTDSSILDQVGLNDGSIGVTSLDSEGNSATYGFNPQGSLTDFDLKINGINVPAATDDGYSSVNADSSAEAIANAINAVADQTGVTAGFTPVSLQASGAVETGTMDSGDLIINGVDIFTTPTNVIALDTDNVLMDAINAKEAQTGIMASRDASGTLILSPTPLASPENLGSGRNLHVETSANGEQLSHLNGIDPVGAASKVYKGSVQLHSDRSFILESTPFGANNYEAGLEALGVAGGVTYSGEPGDVSGDGRIAVQYIHQEEGNVRYCGDRENDIQIKVGKRSTIDVTKNGQDAIMDLGVFDAFNHLEDALTGINFRTVTGIHQAADLNATLGSGATGLEVEDSDFPLASGSLEITVTDHSYSPPRPVSMEIPIDITEDTLNSVATKINGVPGLMASWDDTGHLQINTTDEERYTFSMTDKYSNFLRTTGTDFGQIQHQALDQSLTELDELLGSLTTQITDFGARANRLQVQSRIYDNLELSTAENLSEKQDTDMIEALMQLKAKEVAYQAALSAAAKTMQISLVDYL